MERENKRKRKKCSGRKVGEKERKEKEQKEGDGERMEKNIGGRRGQSNVKDVLGK